MLSRLRDERGSWTLIGLLVAVAVGLAIFVFVLMPRVIPEGKNSQAVKEGLVQPKEGQTVVGASMDKAKETDCSSRIRQIRMSIEQYKAENGNAPATLQDMKLPVAAYFYTCPANGQAYQYDGASGAVTCPTPGHNGF